VLTVKIEFKWSNFENNETSKEVLKTTIKVKVEKATEKKVREVRLSEDTGSVRIRRAAGNVIADVIFEEDVNDANVEVVKASISEAAEKGELVFEVNGETAAVAASAVSQGQDKVETKRANPTQAASDNCYSKLFPRYAETSFTVKTKDEAKELIAAVKKAFKTIKESYRSAKVNLRKLGREANE
jgi:hypothetical protein